MRSPQMRVIFRPSKRKTACAVFLSFVSWYVYFFFVFKFFFFLVLIIYKNKTTNRFCFFYGFFLAGIQFIKFIFTIITYCINFHFLFSLSLFKILFVVPLWAVWACALTILLYQLLLRRLDFLLQGCRLPKHQFRLVLIQQKALGLFHP